MNVMSVGIIIIVVMKLQCVWVKSQPAMEYLNRNPATVVEGYTSQWSDSTDYLETDSFLEVIGR